MHSKKSIIKDDLPESVTWEKINNALENDKYKQQVQGLDTAKLKSLAQDSTYSKTLIYAKEAIKRTQPEKLTEKYIEQVASGMKNMAKMLIKKRSSFQE
jgi:hypothetical protein